MDKAQDKQFSATVAICTYSQVKTRAVMSHLELEKCPNPKMTVRYQDGDALIGRSRSIVANKFLTHTKDDLLMFLDEDIVISTLDITKLLWEAHKLNLPVVGAAYATKSKENPGFAIRPLADGVIKFGKDGGLYEVRSISTGCMVIQRKVLEKMIETEKVHYCKHGERGYYPFFQDKEMLIGGQWEHISEDWFFTEIAMELGFKIWCDTTIKLGHIGQYEYTWDDVLDVKQGKRKSYDSPSFKVTNNVKREERDVHIDIGDMKGEIIKPGFDFKQDLKRILGLKPISAPALNGNEAVKA